MEELQTQNFNTVLASTPPVVVSSSHIGGDKEMLDCSASTEIGAWLMPPPLIGN